MEWTKLENLYLKDRYVWLDDQQRIARFSDYRPWFAYLYDLWCDIEFILWPLTTWLDQRIPLWVAIAVAVVIEVLIP